MPHWICYYHIVWATKYRQPTITSQIEPFVYQIVRDKAVDLRGNVLALNGVSDHIHLAVSLPPTIALAKFIADVKGVSSRRVNAQFPMEDTFRWQEGYSVQTFGERALETIVAYIENQKQHHANDQLNAYFEDISED